MWVAVRPRLLVLWLACNVIDALIYDAVRTPRGKAKPTGGLAGLSPQHLVKSQIDALQERQTGAVEAVEALTLGCVTQVDDQGGHIALSSKHLAGLPEQVAALSINNFCASGLTAIGHAIALVQSGRVRSALAGGVECMSRVPFLGDNAAYYRDLTMPKNSRFVPVVVAADRLAEAEGIARDALDQVALVSQMRSADAEKNPGLLKSRIATGKLTAEECIRPQTTHDSLKQMQPAFASFQDDCSDMLDGDRFPARHTLGHAPPICDGAGLACIGTADLDGVPRARVISFAERGGDPKDSLTAGFNAMDVALHQAGLTLDDMDRIEFMEAFAVTMAKFMRDRSPDPARVNVSGGHVAKGHPMGATGAILTSTLLDALETADATLGLVVVTGAQGVGAAMIVERLN